MNKNLPDRKYYNVAMANNEQKNGYSFASYKDLFTQTLVENPSLYYLSIIRLQVPTSDIPILIPEVESYPNVDVNRLVYNVTLEWNGFTSGTVPLTFFTMFPLVDPRPITINDPNPMNNPSRYYWIYDYRHFIDIVNNAFVTAYNNLQVASGGTLPATVIAPYITYNGDNELMTYHYSPDYLDTAIIPVKAYMNYKLFTFFNGVENNFYDFIDPKGIQLLVKDYHGQNIFGAQYIMSQQYRSTPSWNVFKSVQIVSSFLSTEDEVIPIPSYQTQGSYNTLSVIKDFVPFYDKGSDFRSFINFRFNGSYELVDLNGTTPINLIDLNVYWLDRYGNRYLLTIPYNQILTIKFVFILKETFTG